MFDPSNSRTFLRSPRRPKPLTHIIRAVIATLSLIPCAAAAAFIPPLWQGVSGRDIEPQATTMAIFILLLAAFLRAGLRWSVVDFAASILCMEGFTLCVISHFTGFTGLDLLHWFNMLWLKTMSIFIAIPWLVGLLIGSLLLMVRRRESHERAA